MEDIRNAVVHNQSPAVAHKKFNQLYEDQSSIADSGFKQELFSQGREMDGTYDSLAVPSPSRLDFSRNLKEEATLPQRLFPRQDPQQKAEDLPKQRGFNLREGLGVKNPLTRFRVSLQQEALEVALDEASSVETKKMEPVLAQNLQLSEVMEFIGGSETPSKKTATWKSG